MTFLTSGSESALAIRDTRPTVPGEVPSATSIDLLRLFGLNRPSSGRRIVCHWHRTPDGGLARFWEPDIVPIPPR